MWTEQGNNAADFTGELEKDKDFYKGGAVNLDRKSEKCQVQLSHDFFEDSRRKVSAKMMMP